MTGAEVVIRNGRTCVLGKVRHDGYDVVDFFNPKNLSQFSGSPKELWDAYRHFRASQYGYSNPLGGDADIDSRFLDGFEFPFRGGDLEHLIQTAENMITAVDPDDGYLCSYGDYCLLIEFIPTDRNNQSGHYEVVEGKECFEEEEE
jgi:hypothetical protein